MKVALKKIDTSNCGGFKATIRQAGRNSSKEDLPNKLLASGRLVLRNKLRSEVVHFSYVFYFEGLLFFT